VSDSPLLWVKVLGLVIAGIAFVAWQFADLKRARKASQKSLTRQKNKNLTTGSED
jgi:hypothetical protein